MFTPPTRDTLFAFHHLLDLRSLPPDRSLDADILEPVLDEAAKFARNVLAPLNRSGDTQGAMLEQGKVVMPEGFAEAYLQFVEGGWNAVPFASDYGGQNLPWSLTFALQEMWQGANLAFGLCPLLTQGAIEAISRHGTPEQKETYLAKLISGQWTGTMNLTEPQAGSDLGAIRAEARQQDDGSYLLKGQKIYITYGEHDLAENIIHLVLARTANAPEGSKGLSLFVVPKFLPGSGERNDVQCVSIEHKLGIHASPTCTMSFGDSGGAQAWLVGEQHGGLQAMFTMMNNARLSVGVQGIGLAEHACQKARAYAEDRIQFGPIINHPDVRRMLLAMESQAAAGRLMYLETGLEIDKAHGGDAAAQAFVDFVTPIIKFWGTEMAVEAASTCIQVHGGMGYIEEGGAAQFLRDARILPIYEGTNGIQANDLVFRKIQRDGGQAAEAFIKAGEAVLKEVRETPGEDFETMRISLATGLEALRTASDQILRQGRENQTGRTGAIAVPAAQLFGIVYGGIVLCRAAAKAQSLNAAGDQSFDPEFLEYKIRQARYYAEHYLPRASGLALTVEWGGNWEF